MTTLADTPRPPSPASSTAAPPAYPTAAGHRADWDCRRRKRILAAAALTTLLAAGGGAAACWTAYQTEVERTAMVGVMALPLSVNVVPLPPPASGGNAP